MDHHHSLVQARRLVRAADLPEEPLDERVKTASQFLGFWREEIARHFSEEEEVLLPWCSSHGDLPAENMTRVLLDHVRLRGLTLRLRDELAAGDELADTLRAIGRLLRQHIRYEEDVLFPAIQDAVPEEALAGLGRELERFPGSFRPLP